jgi:uncharacterized protein DUF262/RAMA domain-containing protein/uncharacterized protein DUF1524
LLVTGSAQIGANVMSLRLLFTDTNYLIDNYQREYAWSQDDVQILIDDLWEGFGGQNGRPAETFFLGPFVYVQHDLTSRWLVDGQQRFTTLHLILLHLHLIAQRCDEPDTAAKLYNLVYGYTRHNRPRRFRIDISERRPALEALRDGKQFTITGKTLSVQNLWQRGEQLRGLLEERIDSENCARFVDWMLDQVVMVAITAPDRPSGYRIFESMNDRGTRLTPVDLLKSHLMSQVGDAEDEAAELNNKWRTMLADLTAAGDDDPDTPRIFLKAALLAHWAQPGTADARTIDAALHLWVKENPRLIGLDRPRGYFRFIDTLIKLANHYAMFLRAAHSVDHKNGAQSIYFNHANGLNNQMALLMAAVQPGDSVAEARSKASLAANFLDLMFVTRTLADDPTDARQFQEVIDDVIPQLRRSGTMAEIISTLTRHLPDNDPFTGVSTFGMRGTNYRQVKYLLARLTAYVESGCRVDVGAERFLDSPHPWQVEHVFANHPERYSAEIPDPATFRSLRARLGVLLLLPSSDNASFNDAPYDEKIGYYSRHNRLAAILDPRSQQRNPSVRNFVTKNGLSSLFHSFGDNPEMTVVVESRGLLYQELCRQIWSAEAVGLPVPKAKVQPEKQAQPEMAVLSQAAVPASATTAQVKKAAAPTKSSAGAPTQISKLVQAKVLGPGTELRGTHHGTTYTAHVEADGHIRLASGDHYRKPDDAARIAVGVKNISGMAFWHVNDLNGQQVSLRDVFSQAQKNGRLAVAQSGRC